MKKVVYNDRHGGFAMSKIAAMWLAARGVDEAVLHLAELERESDHWGSDFYPDSLARHSTLLVECVESLGEKANGSFSSLAITEVVDLYRIEDYDGLEQVVQPDQIRWTSAVNSPEVLYRSPPPPDKDEEG